MSQYSGKCDLYDHITMSVGIDREKCTSDYDYELKCFQRFKEKTGGRIYQKFKLKLTPWNIDKEIAYRNNPNYLSKKEIRTEVKDKRCKSGYREVITYTYTYLLKEYKSLDEINKVGYYGDKVIYLVTIYDLIPYYAHTIAIAACNETNETIFISNMDYNEEKYYSFRESGLATDYLEENIEALRNHYNSMVIYMNEHYAEEKI